MIKFKDLFPDGTNNVITVFEMLPPFLNKLHILAKNRAVERACKHVWPISTEQDLNNIV